MARAVATDSCPWSVATHPGGVPGADRAHGAVAPGAEDLHAEPEPVDQGAGAGVGDPADEGVADGEEGVRPEAGSNIFRSLCGGALGQPGPGALEVLNGRSNLAVTRRARLL
jgi:hypothetical protein